MTRAVAAALVLAVMPHVATAQDRPAIRAGVLPEDLRLDGRLDEEAWAAAEPILDLTMVEPTQGGVPTAHTQVRVLANAHAIVFGIVCEDPEPAKIVSFTTARDAALDAEDHVAVVLDTSQDGRSGYVFAVNPRGARYDALIQNGSQNSDWDGIWEAATARLANGWSIEIRIPITTLNFKRGLTEWNFNVQRRLQRLQETTRWASPMRDLTINQTSRAGRLTGLPAFNLGLGGETRPAVRAGGGKAGPEELVTADRQASLDVTQRLGPNVLGSLTINTDFAETEVDTRRTNLTRFPLFFPEKRTFFLRGADIFDFGLGLDTDVVPFFSRRIGLVGDTAVPIGVGGKVNGRIDRTNVGAVIVGTRAVDAVAPEAGLGVVRVSQNILGESSVGMIATFGDPLGRAGSWLAGGDVKLQTSHFRGDRNFAVGLWGLATGRSDLAGDRTAAGFLIDYPNDLWGLSFSTKRIGDAFDPSLGFVPRAGIYSYAAGIEYKPRPAWPSLGVRQMFFEQFYSFVTDLQGRWESYRLFWAPINTRLESGDRFEFNIVPTGERLPATFVLEGLSLAPGPYHWRRYRLEGETAAKRKFSGQATWWFGGFYDGTLDQVILTGSWNPSPLVTIGLSAERNTGHLIAGAFTQTLTGVRTTFNFSSDLQVNSFIQYDTDSRTIGSNTRLRWTFNPSGDLFVIYNHNVRDLNDRWSFDSNQLLVKLQYAIRY
jgi:uncharacterized protein DUF5916